MHTTRRRFIQTLAAGTALSGWIGSAAAQTSGRPLSLVVGYAPGGLTDLMARLFAPEFSNILGRQVVVENRPGANGNLATSFVMNAPANGEVLLFTSGSQMVLNSNIYPSFRFVPYEALTPIGLIGAGDFLITTSTALGVDTIHDFIRLAQDKPGQLTYGTSGLGGFGHLCAELLKMRTNIHLRPVHYRGASLMIPELMANQIQMVIDGPTLMKENIEAGKLKGLALMGKTRSKLTPDVPTTAEAGLDGLDDVSNWFGLMAPKGLPQDITSHYRDAMHAALKNADYVVRMNANDVMVGNQSAEQFTQRLQTEFALYGEIAQAANIVAE